MTRIARRAVSIASGDAGSKIAGSTLQISLGRPVLPPEARARSTGEVRSGRGPSSRAGSGTNPVGTAVRPAASSTDPPTTSAGSARSMIASRSGDGSRGDTRLGTAPSFQVARQATNHSGLFGSAIVTMSPSPTPRSA